MEETKTAEEIVEYIRSMPVLSNKETYQSAVEMVKNYAITQQQSANAELKKQIAELVEALKIIANWELPESGCFWDIEKTKPMSYEAAFGSNGARDFIKLIAQNAIKTHHLKIEG